MALRHTRLAGYGSERFMRKRSSGFTILEMLLVLTLAIAVVVIVVPNFSKGLSTAELRSAVRDLASSLRYLRGYAVSTLQEAEFSLDVKENTYRLSGKSKEYSISDSIHLTLLTTESEIKGKGSGVIRFYPDGSSSGGRITLKAGDRTRIVDVNWLTGQVEIHVE